MCIRDSDVSKPISFYAATKKSNELMAYAYSHLYQIPATGLRFFTVYGPWGRPDMAYFSFTEKMRQGEPIQIFNYGDMRRDFTYIDDVVHGVISVMLKPPVGEEKHTLYNIGNNTVSYTHLDVYKRQGLREIIKQSDIVITPKLHVAIFASLHNKVIFSFPVHPSKTTRYFRQINYLEHCHPIESVDYDFIVKLFQKRADSPARIPDDMKRLAEQNLSLLDIFLDQL